MSDYEIGYRKPPRHTRFKKGVCPNPAGRGKRRTPPIGAVAREILDEHASVAMRGRRRRLTRREIWIRQCVALAVKGNIDSAASLLKIRDLAMRFPGLEPVIITVTGGLPDGRERLGEEETI